MLNRRHFLGLGLAVPFAVSADPAQAGVARALPLSAMIRHSDYAVIATALEGSSRWESEGKQRRIVTYTRVRVDETVAGAAAGSELLIRTLGGRVGKIGQIVHGAATLTIGELALLFLKPDGAGRERITAMAQGHFPVRKDDQGVRRLYPSPRLSSLIGKSKHSAVAQLVKQPVSDGSAIVREAWKKYGR